MSKGSSALLTLVPKSSVYMDYPDETFLMPSTLPKTRVKRRGVFMILHVYPNCVSIAEGMSLWDIPGKFQLKVLSAGNLNVSKDASLVVYAGLYHGAEEVCTVANTRGVQVADHADSAVWQWNENIEFDVEARDLPRGGRLCLSVWAVYGSSKKSKKKGQVSSRAMLI